MFAVNHFTTNTTSIGDKVDEMLFAMQMFKAIAKLNGQVVREFLVRFVDEYGQYVGAGNSELSTEIRERMFVKALGHAFSTFTKDIQHSYLLGNEVQKTLAAINTAVSAYSIADDVSIVRKAAVMLTTAAEENETAAAAPRRKAAMANAIDDDES